MTKPVDIPQDVWDAAEALASQMRDNGHISQHPEPMARAILAERKRWAPAVTYFNNYCLDEAEDADNCVCGQEQHDHAKAFERAVKGEN